MDTNIGGIGRLLTLTLPLVQRRHGMARVFPCDDASSMIGRYLSTEFYGFMTGPALVMPAADGVSGGSRGAYLAWITIVRRRGQSCTHLILKTRASARK